MKKYIGSLFFPLFLIIILSYISYAKHTKGYTECYQNRELIEQTPKNEITKIINPMNMTTVLCLLMTIVCSFKETNKSFEISIGNIQHILHAILLHRMLHVISLIIQYYLNDKTCSLKRHYNGISDHCFTLIYFLTVFIIYIKTYKHYKYNKKDQSNENETVSIGRSTLNFDAIDLNEIQSTEEEKNNRKEHSFIERIIETIHSYFTVDMKNGILPNILLIIYIIFSLWTSYQTIFYGYHTPKQMIYGLIYGCISSFVYIFFIRNVYYSLRGYYSMIFGIILAIIGNFITNIKFYYYIRNIIIFGLISICISLIKKYIVKKNKN